MSSGTDDTRRWSKSLSPGHQDSLRTGMVPMPDAGEGDVSWSHDAGAETTTTMIGADWLTIHCRLAIQ
jgi:hypothetical protein